MIPIALSRLRSRLRRCAARRTPSPNGRRVGIGRCAEAVASAAKTRGRRLRPLRAVKRGGSARLNGGMLAIGMAACAAGIAVAYLHYARKDIR